MGAFIPPPSDPAKLRDHVRGPGGWCSLSQAKLLADYHAEVAPDAEVQGFRLSYERASKWYTELKTARNTSASQHRPGLYAEPPGGWDAMPGAAPAPQTPPSPPPDTATALSSAPPSQASAPLVVAQPVEVEGFTLQLVEVVKRSILRGVKGGVTDDELRYYLLKCRALGADPLSELVYAFRDTRTGGLVVAPRVDWFLARAESTGQLDHVETEIIRDAKGDPREAIAKVYRKGSTGPTVGRASLASFDRGTPNWRQMPDVMLEVRALSRALRWAFPQVLGGTYTREEMEEYDSSPSSPSPPPEHRQWEEPPPAQSTGGTVGAAQSGVTPTQGGHAAAAPPTGGSPGTTPPSGGQPAPYHPAECDMLRSSIHHLLDSADTERRERALAEFR
ncbi:MAG: recombinase RecT, partial [Euryarchaeota archaeon]|nr:recombinase RecT [Euryarchaeota archaeon]